jgi:hypothetical protein
MNNISRSALTLVLGAALSLSGIAGASAATWAQNHPRRVEVNARLANQNKRIDADLASGKITAKQAARLHREDRMARKDERFDAGFDKSHLTNADQRSLNQDENGISKQINSDAH